MCAPQVLYMAHTLVDDVRVIVSRAFFLLLKTEFS